MIEIVRKTKDYVVIYKPAGMPSQSDPSGDKDAMTECAEYLRESGEQDQLFLIHRLDRVVGGLLVFARNKKSAADLSSQVADRKMTKEYCAVIEGDPDGGVMQDYIYKDAVMGKAFITDRKRAGAKACELEYSVLDRINVDGRDLALVKILLKTGRFHQIRAQFSHRKMPLIGDKKYGSRDSRAKTPALFASSLSFVASGEKTEVLRLPDLTEYPWSLFPKEKYTERNVL